MDIPAAAGSAPRPPVRSWPPSAPPQRTELSTTAAVLILVAASFVTYVLMWAPPRVHDPTGAARWLVVIHVVRLALWLGIIGALGWWRPAGLAIGSVSAWGIVPLTLFGLAILAGAGLADVPNGPGYLVLLLAGDLLGALREEVAFRGFLLHALTRRLGGASAVVVGSVLFAACHVPRYVHEGRGLGETLAFLVVAFGVGVFLCRVRVETGSIWFPAAIHTLWNILSGVGGWAPEHGDPSGALAAMHTIPFALGILMFVVLAVPRSWAEPMTR